MYYFKSQPKTLKPLTGEEKRFEWTLSTYNEKPELEIGTTNLIEITEEEYNILYSQFIEYLEEIQVQRKLQTEAARAITYDTEISENNEL